MRGARRRFDDGARRSILAGEVLERDAAQALDGDAAGVIAGIMAAKRTHELIPLCHPLALTGVAVDLTTDVARSAVDIEAEVKTTGRTGVEMEAIVAVCVAAATVYDMAKAVEKTMRIQNIRLVEKHGGRSGDVVNEA